MNLIEKAKSKAQQRLMGAVLNAKRTGEASTPEVAKLALNMKTSDVKDFASTKHKGLPEKKEVKEGSEHTQWSASIMLPSKRRKFVVVSCPSRDRKDAIQIIKALYGTDDIKQLNRIGIRTEEVVVEASYKDFVKRAQEASDRAKKLKQAKKDANAKSAYRERVTKGVRFYDPQGSGHIKDGKKVYS